ncbi:MAG: hypothetical protein SAK29_10930 [Scytonema sp. PMC 1069.18]|nr:hypothetical protein [Scytonema sp. PMC 1069.18]MEC4885354.1 hypothetical protein [Scytonema sp. PMC 1070.18]
MVELRQAPSDVYEDTLMLLSYLVLLIVSLSSIWLGLKITEEVYRIAVVFAGVILLIMVFVLAPSYLQIGILLLSLGLHRLYTPQRILD